MKQVFANSCELARASFLTPCSFETLCLSQTHVHWWVSTLAGVEPPGDFAGRFTRRLTDHAHRAGIAPPHAAGDELSGVTGDDGLRGVTGVPVAFPDGLPVARAINPWAMPEAST